VGEWEMGRLGDGETGRWGGIVDNTFVK